MFDFLKSKKLKALEAENNRLRDIIEEKFEPKLMEYSHKNNQIDMQFKAPALVAILAKQLDDWFLENGAKNNISMIVSYGPDKKPNDKVSMTIRDYDVVVQRRWGESVADQRNKYRSTMEKVVGDFAPEGGWTAQQLCDLLIERNEQQKKLIAHMVGQFHCLAQDFNLGDMPLIYENLATVAVSGAFGEFIALKNEIEEQKAANKPA